MTVAIELSHTYEIVQAAEYLSLTPALDSNGNEGYESDQTRHQYIGAEEGTGYARYGTDGWLYVADVGTDIGELAQCVIDDCGDNLTIESYRQLKALATSV